MMKKLSDCSVQILVDRNKIILKRKIAAIWSKEGVEAVREAVNFAIDNIREVIDENVTVGYYDEDKKLVEEPERKLRLLEAYDKIRSELKKIISGIAIKAVSGIPSREAYEDALQEIALNFIAVTDPSTDEGERFLDRLVYSIETMAENIEADFEVELQKILTAFLRNTAQQHGKSYVQKQKKF